MPHKERTLKQKQKELREAAKDSGSLTSWMTKGTKGKNNMNQLFTL